MKRIRIDFAPPGLRRSLLRAPRLAWALLLVALAVLPAAVQTNLAYRALLRDEVRSQARVQAAQAAPPPAPVAARAPVPQAQANAVNAAVMQLNLPWRALHDAVQSATPANVALLALEPDARRSTLRITAEARASDDMLAYVAQLQRETWFNEVTLVRHEINEQDPNRPIRFQIDAAWRAAP